MLRYHAFYSVNAFLVDTDAKSYTTDFFYKFENQWRERSVQSCQRIVAHRLSGRLLNVMVHGQLVQCINSIFSSFHVVRAMFTYVDDIGKVPRICSSRRHNLQQQLGSNSWQIGGTVRAVWPLRNGRTVPCYRSNCPSVLSSHGSPPPTNSPPHVPTTPANAAQVSCLSLAEFDPKIALREILQ